MSDKRKRDLEAVSRIDDEIIEKNTEKRIKLLSAAFRRKNPKPFVALVAVIALLAIALSSFIVMYFVGRVDEKQVPVYKGMTVLSSYDNGGSAEKDGMDIELLATHGPIYLGNGNGNNGNNGNGNGNGKRPIKDIVKDSVSLSVPPQQMYYAKPNQDIYINVHISNPDNFEILSFTLNGKKYSSYMFEEGSDMENLILKCNVGDVEGIVEYTIDAIKYVDGTDIKDVIIGGDRTVKVGVEPKSQPSCLVEQAETMFESIKLNVKLTDNLDLIALSGGKAYIVLCDDNGALGMHELTEGKSESFSFDKLSTGTTYRYAVVAVYDALDGEGFSTHVIYEGEVTTQSILAFSDLTPAQESVSFNIEWNEEFEGEKSLKSLQLYMGGLLVSELDAHIESISGLLSGVEYRLVAVYDDSGIYETAEYVFTTLKKTAPTVTVTARDVGQESFKFDIGVTDPDGLYSLKAIELINGESVVKVEDLAIREFNDLLSNNNYTVKVTYTYDLNDGKGICESTVSLDVKTLAKTAPEFTFEGVADVTSLSGKISCTDPDGIIKTVEIGLYKGEDLILNVENDTVAANDLEYFTDYCVKVAYTYDLNDGKGIISEDKAFPIKTLPYIAVTSANVSNIGTILVGDTVNMSLKLDNPLFATATSATVNGVEYEAKDVSPGSFNISIETDDFSGGLMDCVVEKVTVNLGGELYTIILEETVTAQVFIVGDVQILSADFVNRDNEIVECGFPSEVNRVLVTLDNETGYELVSVVCNGMSDITVIDNNSFYFTCDELFTKDLSLILNFSSEYIEGTIERRAAIDDHHRLISDEIKYISNAEDFLRIEEGFYYELTCDIDLGGMNFFNQRCAAFDYFNGVIDGKGFAIKNFVVGIGTPSFGYMNSAIFDKLYGIIKNIVFENVQTTKDTDDYGNIGRNYALLVKENYGIIENCIIDESCEFSATIKGSYSLGMIAGVNYGTVKNCVNYGTIKPYVIEEFNGNRAGGIVGSNEAGGEIIDCENHGELVWGDTNGYLGGIAGVNEGRISGCKNYGMMSLNRWAAGISAINGGLIENCENNGVIYGYNSNNELDYIAAGISCFNQGITYCWADYDPNSTVTLESGEIKNSVNNASMVVNRPENCITYGIADGGSVTDCKNNGKLDGKECFDITRDTLE